MAKDIEDYIKHMYLIKAYNTNVTTHESYISPTAHGIRLQLTGLRSQKVTNDNRLLLKVTFPLPTTFYICTKCHFLLHKTHFSGRQLPRNIKKNTQPFNTEEWCQFSEKYGFTHNNQPTLPPN